MAQTREQYLNKFFTKMQLVDMTPMNGLYFRHKETGKVIPLERSFVRQGAVTKAFKDKINEIIANL